MIDSEPNEEARTLAAELLQRIALDASGTPFNDDDPETWDAADAAKPEIVSLGAVRLKIVDPDAVHLAIAVGAIGAGDATLAMRVAFDTSEGMPMPAMGQYVVLQTEEPGVAIVFAIWLCRSDLDDSAAPDLGADAVRNEALDVLQPGEALLVQVLNVEAQQ